MKPHFQLPIKKDTLQIRRKLPAEFTEHVVGYGIDQWKISPEKRLREADRIRLHTVSEDEKAKFRIPESMIRINIHLLHDFLLLCGGYAGVRFQAEELHLISIKTAELDKLFPEIEQVFNLLTNSEKKLTLTETAQNPNVSAGDNGLITIPPLPPPFILSNLPIPVAQFHEKLDEYLKLVQALQAIARVIRERLLTTPENPIITKKDEIPEHCQRPRWIEVLIEKYCREYLRRINGDEEKKQNRQGFKLFVPPLAEFAAFLSCCVVNQIPSTNLEFICLEELIAASINHENDRIYNRTQKYWSKRLFDFMKCLSEFKSANKNDACLYIFNKFIV